MLTDLAELVQKYIGCKDCYFGYNNYDQKIFHEFDETDRIDYPKNIKILPRFEKCTCIQQRYALETVNEYKEFDLPKGVINCVTLIGYTSNSNICVLLNNGYPIIGERTMVFIPNIFDHSAIIKIRNFTGIIRFHYVNYIVHPGCYLVSRKVVSWRLRYIIYDHNEFEFNNDELQIMWNYVYPGRRPKNMFLFYAKSSPICIYRFNINLINFNYIEAGSYSWLRVSDIGISLRHA